MKKTSLLLLVIIVALSACGPSGKTSKNYSTSQAALIDDDTFELNEISDDESYGYTEKNPIKVGGSSNNEGPRNERRFLNALLGPKGEVVTYQRQGSCCPFKSQHGFMGRGMLDRYEVKFEGQAKPVYIYINMYDFGKLKAPKGFTIKKRNTNA